MATNVLRFENAVEFRRVNKTQSPNNLRINNRKRAFGNNLKAKYAESRTREDVCVHADSTPRDVLFDGRR